MTAAEMNDVVMAADELDVPPAHPEEGWLSAFEEWLNQSWGSSVPAGFAAWLRSKVDEACLFQESPMDYELVCLQVAVGSPTSEPQLWQLSPEITTAVGWRAVHAGSVLHKLLADRGQQLQLGIVS